MKRVRFEQRAYRVSRVMDSTYEREGEVDGLVLTPLGFVRVWSGENGSNPDGCGPTTAFWFIWEGVEYDRRYNQQFSRMGVVRLAARFAREIVAADGPR